jgi:putative tryptophan/tyrosine transport system substrate-binding protein
MNPIGRRDFIAGAAGAAAWPLAAQAQQRALPVIGILTAAPSATWADYARNAFAITPFLSGLREQGYTEGRNIEILYRSAEQQYEHLPKLAADLVDHRVSVIFAGTSASAVAAKSATEIIPIVFGVATDPVELGFVQSLSRPAGNVTGVYFLVQELTAKRLELLHEIVPAASTIGFLVNPVGPITEAEKTQAETAARNLGLRLITANASTPNEIEAAVATLVGQGIEALLVGGDTLFINQYNQLSSLAARAALPTIYPYRQAVDGGGLMSYGAGIADAYHTVGSYVGRILRGEKPADLPVQQSTRIEMVLNLKTAKALGIEFPRALLVRADEVIG